MPIVINQLIPANNLLQGYAIAKELARQQVALTLPLELADIDGPTW